MVMHFRNPAAPRRWTRRVLAALLGTASSAASAQSLTWLDACDISPSDSEQRKLVDATGLIVDDWALADHGTYYSLATSLFLSYDGAPLSADSLFRGSVRFDEGRARTAFLVAPDKIVTAPHGDSFYPGSKIIFGLHNAVGTCTAVDALHIPKANVRSLGPAVVTSPVPNDFALYALSAPVTDRPFLRLRRDGVAAAGDEVAIASHTFRIPQRVDAAGYVDSVVDGVPLFRRLHTEMGASGSAVFNLSQQFVETIVAPQTTSCALNECFSLVPGSACIERRISSACPAEAFPINPMPATTIAANLPALELLVSPLTPVIKRALLSGPVTEPTTTYTLSAANLVGSPGPVSYEIVVPPPASHTEPYLALAAGTPTTGTVARGSSLPVVVQTVKPATLPACGTYEREFHVYDRTHAFKDTVKQRIEIARSGFEVVSATPLTLDGIQTPYSRQTSLVVRNPYLVPVTLTFHASQTWLKLDGTAGTYLDPAQVTATVAPGATHTVLVGLSPLASTLSAPGTTVYEAGVTVSDNDLACGQTPAVTVPLLFTPGSLTVTVPLEEAVPAAPVGGASTPLAATLTVGESFCITDVRARYGVRAAGFPKPQFNAWQQQEARWRLYAPLSLTPIPLQEPGVAPGGPQLTPMAAGTCPSPDGSSEACWTVDVGTSTSTPPPTCAQVFPGGGVCRELADTLGTPATGSWSMRLSDEVAGGAPAQPTLLQWTLTFLGTPVCAK